MYFVKSRRAQSEFDYETWIEGGVMPTLNDFDNKTESRATAVILFEATRVDDVRIYEKYSPTVATYWGTGGARVPYVFPIQGTIIGRADTAGPQGKGYGNETDPMFTLDTIGGHGAAQVFEPKSVFEENWAESEVKNALRANASKSSHAVIKHSVVRRLTPMECERLQGFPDNWTENQADSNRYKQMGNAVAIPVVNFIIERMVRQIEE